jgi:hypothetical protein
LLNSKAVTSKTFESKVGKNITLPVMYQITLGEPDYCFLFNAKLWKTGHVTWWLFSISAISHYH